MARAKFDRALIPARPDLRFESGLWAAGALHPAGLDEAGRGALAGPVTAAAVILPCGCNPETLAGVRDSKEMTPVAREHWAACIHAVAGAWAVGWASAEEIDALGIAAATRLAMRRAVEQLAPAPEHLLVDYLPLPELATPQTALIKGDARCLSIAAASVLAKTARDAHMRALDVDYPGYGFAAHKGYGTIEHRRRLAELGPCPLHRRSFAPLASANNSLDQNPSCPLKSNL